MANMSFDFNNIQRSFFTTRLKDGRKLVVKMPMKKTFQKMSGMTEADTEKMTPDDAIDTLANICAEVLSNNMDKEKVTMEYMVENYDLEEMNEFMKHFMGFCNQAKNDPN